MPARNAGAGVLLMSENVNAVLDAPTACSCCQNERYQNGPLSSLSRSYCRRSRARPAW